MTTPDPFPHHVHIDDSGSPSCEYCGEKLGYFHMCGCHFDNSRCGIVAHLDDAGAPRCDDYRARRREAGACVWLLGILMGLLLILAGAIWCPAVAEEARYLWPGPYGGAWVELHEPAPDAPGAVASLTFNNEEVHSGDATFALEWNGLRVEVEMEWNVDGTHGAERIIVTPPEGYVAAPRHLTVGEHDRQTLHIYPNGVGM